MLQENPDRVRLRDAIVSAHAELRERELIKLAALASAVAGALRDRGIAEPTASLAAETGVAVFKIAFARWISEPGQPDLPGIIRESMGELRGMLTDRPAGADSLRLLLARGQWPPRPVPDSGAVCVRSRIGQTAGRWP